jgi:hypothetical protein
MNTNLLLKGQNVAPEDTEINRNDHETMNAHVLAAIKGTLLPRSTNEGRTTGVGERNLDNESKLASLSLFHTSEDPSEATTASKSMNLVSIRRPHVVMKERIPKNSPKTLTENHSSAPVSSLRQGMVHFMCAEKDKNEGEKAVVTISSLRRPISSRPQFRERIREAAFDTIEENVNDNGCNQSAASVRACNGQILEDVKGTGGSIFKPLHLEIQANNCPADLNPIDINPQNLYVADVVPAIENSSISGNSSPVNGSKSPSCNNRTIMTSPEPIKRHRKHRRTRKSSRGSKSSKNSDRSSSIPIEPVNSPSIQRDSLHLSSSKTSEDDEVQLSQTKGTLEQERAPRKSALSLQNSGKASAFPEVVDSLKGFNELFEKFRLEKGDSKTKFARPNLGETKPQNTTAIPRTSSVTSLRSTRSTETRSPIKQTSTLFKTSESYSLNSKWNDEQLVVDYMTHLSIVKNWKRSDYALDIKKFNQKQVLTIKDLKQVIQSGWQGFGVILPSVRSAIEEEL